MIIFDILNNGIYVNRPNLSWPNTWDVKIKNIVIQISNYWGAHSMEMVCILV